MGETPSIWSKRLYDCVYTRADIGRKTALRSLVCIPESFEASAVCFVGCGSVVCTKRNGGAWETRMRICLNGLPLAAETLVDKAVELNYYGGTVGGNIRPTPFICLLLKMLQIQPDKEIIVEFIKNEDFKYVATVPPTGFPQKRAGALLHYSHPCTHACKCINARVHVQIRPYTGCLVHAAHRFRARLL
jgi:hypothetical protein